MIKKYLSPIVYAVKHKDVNERLLSQSGGAFVLLSDYILENKGVVYGCAFDEFIAVHKRAITTSERDDFRGSKYIQSKLNDVFIQIKLDLQEGRLVLFSGTSCQVAGLQSFLSDIDCSRLYTVDIVCHGVPSPRVWLKYLEYCEKKFNGKIDYVIFRNKKKYGWSSHIETIICNGSEYDSEVFKILFYKHNVLRKSCYKCPYKNIIHPANVSIADFWGVEKSLPHFYDNKGVSLVLINDDKGIELFNKVSPCKMIVSKSKVEDCIQLPLCSPFSEPKNRDKFWNDFYKYDFKYIANKYGGLGLYYNLKKSIRKFIPKKLLYLTITS